MVRKVCTAGTSCLHANFSADFEMYQLSLALISTFPSLKWELTDFTRCTEPGRPRMPEVSAEDPRPFRDTLSHTRSPDSEEKKELGRDSVTGESPKGGPGRPYRVGSADLHGIGYAVGRVAGLGGPPRLRHRLCGPRHGGACPGQLPLNVH